MREYQNKRVALPPEISAFIDRMEQQAGRIVEKRHLTLSAELKSFFAAARAAACARPIKSLWVCADPPMPAIQSRWMWKWLWETSARAIPN